MKIILSLAKYKKYQQQQKCLTVVDGLDTWLASLVIGLTSSLSSFLEVKYEVPTSSINRVDVSAL